MRGTKTKRNVLLIFIYGVTLSHFVIVREEGTLCNIAVTGMSPGFVSNRSYNSKPTMAYAQHIVYGRVQ